MEIEIYGYSENKDVVTTYLTAGEIAAARIHPTKLDLFEPRPIKVKAYGRLLTFTPLSNVVLAFFRSGDSDSLQLGVHDGRAERCYSCTLTHRDVSYIEVTNIRPSHLSFDQYLLEYFTQAQEAPWFGWISNDANQMCLNRGKIRVRRAMRGNDRRSSFSGEMFSKVPLSVNLPKSVNRLFDLFERWQPVVFGRALRGAIGKAGPGTIDFLVDTSRSTFSIKDIQGLPGVTDARFGPASNWAIGEGMLRVAFNLDNTAYALWVRNSVSLDRIWSIIDFSADQLFAQSPNSILASRIALGDIQRRQFRQLPMLSLRTDVNWQDVMSRSTELVDSGLKFVDTPFNSMGQPGPMEFEMAFNMMPDLVCALHAAADLHLVGNHTKFCLRGEQQ